MALTFLNGWKESTEKYDTQTLHEIQISVAIKFLISLIRNLWAFNFSSYISVYAIASLLPAGPQSPMHLLSAPLLKSFATSGFATQLPTGPDGNISSWVTMNRKRCGVRQNCWKTFKSSLKASQSLQTKLSVVWPWPSELHPTCDPLDFQQSALRGCQHLPPVTDEPCVCLAHRYLGSEMSSGPGIRK